MKRFQRRQNPDTQVTQEVYKAIHRFRQNGGKPGHAQGALPGSKVVVSRRGGVTVQFRDRKYVSPQPGKLNVTGGRPADQDQSRTRQMLSAIGGFPYKTPEKRKKKPPRGLGS